MKKFLLCLVSVALSTSALAQTKKLPPKQPPVPLEEPAPVVPREEVVVAPEAVVVPEEKPVFNTRALRGLTRYNGTIHFSPFSSWLPLKYGIAAGYNYNEDWTIEAEYTTKTYSAGLFGVDFGDVTDSRFGIQSRWYPGFNSFNFILGLYRSEFSAELGNAILSRMGAPSGTMLGFSSFGPQFGLSNRWQWRHGVSFGVDWIVMYMPLFGQDLDDKALKAVTNQTDRSDLDKATSALRNIPQFDVLKLNLGYSF